MVVAPDSTAGGVGLGCGLGRVSGTVASSATPASLGRIASSFSSTLLMFFVSSGGGGFFGIRLRWFPVLHSWLLRLPRFPHEALWTPLCRIGRARSPSLPSVWCV